MAIEIRSLSKAGVHTVTSAEQHIVESKDRQEISNRDQQLFRTVFESPTTAIAIVSPQGCFVEVNQTFCRLTSYGAQELKAASWESFVHPLDRASFRAFLDELAAGEASKIPRENRYIRKDGLAVWTRNSGTVIRSDQGQIESLVLFIEDLTSQRDLEAEVRYGEERLRAIFESTPECVNLLDAEGTLLQINSAGLRMLGAGRPDALVGKSFYEIVAPEHRDTFRQFNAQVCAGKKGALNFEIIGLEGRRRELEAHAAPFRRVDGTTVHLSVARDVTDRKRRERGTMLLAAIVDSSDDAIISKDLNGFITSWNKAAERLFGYKSEEVVGKNITILIPPDRQSEEPKILQQLRSGNRIDHFETVRRRKDGGLLDISLTISPVRDEQGVVIGASKIARDVTEIRRAERAALLLAAIVDSSDDAIISKDLNGIITSWNKGAERLFGYSASEAIGKSITILIPEDRLHEEPTIIERVKQGKRIDHYETIRRRKDGTFLDISLTISPIKDANGVIIGASKIARDITERKRAEAALVASEAKFRQLADSMPQIVWTARPDGSFDYYNQRWYQFTGFSDDNPGAAGWEAILHPEDVQAFRDRWAGSLVTGDPFSIEYRFWDRQQARYRWFMGRALAVRDDSGSIVKWFGSCVDIDAQKHVQDELRQVNYDLEQFAYSASHDLQEPLRTVKIYAELLSRRYRDQLDEQGREFCDYVRRGAGRMETLVRDLLAYTQFLKIDAPIDATDTNAVVQETLETLALAIDQSAAEIRCNPLPPVRMHATHLKQLFQNLLGNAIKYRRRDEAPSIHIAGDVQDNTCTFSVRDNGIGIDPEYKEQIFGLFKRLHTGDEYSGTGIGLAICKRIVERYRGRIWVESKAGQGSTFFFSVPR